VKIIKEEILEKFEKFSKSYEDNKGGEKLIALQNYFNKYNISNKYIKGQGLIVNNIDNPRIILVSHIDLIKKFQKGFLKSKTFFIDSNNVTGALDNTLTNAVAVLILKELISNNINDIELILTEGEEIGFIGMKNYLKNNKAKSKGALFVNLDVTNEGYREKMDISIEYDKPSFGIVKKVCNIFKGDNIHYTNDRVCDDTDAIINANCHGFSFCIPTKGTIHSYKNSCRISSIEPYANSLLKLLTNLKPLKEELTSDIYGFNLELALKEDITSLEELNNKTNKSHSKEIESLFDYNYETEDYDYNDSYNDSIDIEELEEIEEEEDYNSIIDKNIFHYDISSKPWKYLEQIYGKDFCDMYHKLSQKIGFNIMKFIYYIDTMDIYSIKDIILFNILSSDILKYSSEEFLILLKYLIQLEEDSFYNPFTVKDLTEDINLSEDIISNLLKSLISYDLITQNGEEYSFMLDN